jgi:hypothetical protein
VREAGFPFLSVICCQLASVLNVPCWNRSTTDQIFYIRQILEKKREYNSTVHQLFIDSKKAYCSVRREALYSILSEFGITRKLVGLSKMCLNEIYSRVRIGKNLSDMFTIQNDLKKRNTQ